MRQWHRRLSLFVGLFMFFIAVTGTVLQAEMMWGEQPAGPPPGAAASIDGESRGPSDAELQSLFASTLAGVRRLSQGRVMGIELRPGGAGVTATVVLAEPQMRKIRLDALTGTPLDQASASGGRDLHGILLDLHRGAVAGSAGLWLSLLCGAVLAVLSVTGLCVYWQSWQRRRRAGQPGLLW